MVSYHYDGSFSGLLTVLEQIASSRSEPAAISAGCCTQLDLFSPPRDMATDDTRAEHFIRMVREKISPRALLNCACAFLSEERDMEMKIWRYVNKGFTVGKDIDFHHHDPAVKDMEGMVGRVSLECHRLKGFTRFQKLKEGLLYAPVEPVHNIITLLAPHFAHRFHNQLWSLHDRKRGIAILYDGQTWSPVSVLEEEQPFLDREEEHYQSLWQVFYRHIAITPRKNPSLQKRLMPARYWKYLPELRDREESRAEQGNV